MEEIALFRAVKRRKLARHHHDSPSGEGSPKPSLDHVDDEDSMSGSTSSEADVGHIIRARNQIKRRPAIGVSFSNAKVASENEEDESTAMTKAEDNLKDIANRFVGSTGQIVNVDRHMTAYIDAELAKRRLNVASRPVDDQHPAERPAPTMSPSVDTAPPNTQVPLEPGRMNRIDEVDLGRSAHDVNLARTQAAIERAKAGQPLATEESKPVRPRKPRIGPDGKPMKPRPRKRRNSEDMARDALVEQVLHEHKLDIYDADGDAGRRLNDLAAEAEGRADTEPDVDADERLAEQFRQEFMEAMADRRQRHKAVSQPKAPGAGTADRGPKLGGSRSARAKMAQQQQQQQGAGQKK